MSQKEYLKEIAKERITILFREASLQSKKNPELAHRYIKLARKIAMKVRVQMPKQYKRRYCKHCYHYLKPGVNLRVRTNKDRVVYYCLDCKRYMRFPIKKRKVVK